MRRTFHTAIKLGAPSGSPLGTTFLFLSPGWETANLHRILGAPGLAFETWETTNPNTLRQLVDKRLHLPQHIRLVRFENHVAGIRNPYHARPWNPRLNRICLRRCARKIIQDNLL